MQFSGTISYKGELLLKDRNLLTQWIKSHAGKNIELEIKVRRKQRSYLQNRYYFGVCVQLVCEALRHLGNDVDEQDTHEFLKGKFNSKKIVNSDGVVEELPISTTKLTTTEMMEYIARIQQWAAEFLGLVIPDPESQLSIELHDQVNDKHVVIIDKITN